MNPLEKIKSLKSNPEALRSYFLDILSTENKEEILKYEKEKKEFYDNPLHWNNNKRKQHGMPVLRGKVNKNREKRFEEFSKWMMFNCIENVIDELLPKVINENFRCFAHIEDLK